MKRPTAAALEAAERGWLPEPVLRLGVRALVARRLRKERAACREGGGHDLLLRRMRVGPVAERPHRPNDQHYELPPEFFRRVLGPRMKYSCGLWAGGVETLARAEEAMLALTAARAGLHDGQRILELGCGWGSLTLWMAERWPGARITAVSNSAPQGAFLRRRAAGAGLDNVSVVTADMNDFRPAGRFDRIVSVEMFEHMRNWEALLSRAAGWLEPRGRLFLHVFAHRRHAYLFRDEGEGDWMARHFFTAGLMPSHDLVDRLAQPLRVEARWWLDGRHYRRTAEAWLGRLEAGRERVEALFGDVYGPSEARRWYHRWRLFFLAVSGMFGHRDGCEWGVSHVRLAPPAGTVGGPAAGSGAEAEEAPPRRSPALAGPAGPDPGTGAAAGGRPWAALRRDGHRSHGEGEP